MNNILYIGLNGYAGSGKDTVAKMLSTMLSNNFETFEEFKEYYNNVPYFKDPTHSATYNTLDNKSTYTSGEKSMCIAFADQLKLACAMLFGIPVTRFYMNKSNSWICINKDFKYTEVKPDTNIITAEEYYYGQQEFIKTRQRYWMSLREILVYVGTYVLQSQIHRNIFVNIVENTIKNERRLNSNLSYVIVTDIRFLHELDYIQDHNGIMINIKRSSVQQLDNTAEHELDDQNDYDYTIMNDGTYDDLMLQLWEIVYNTIEFKNETINLPSWEESQEAYLRKIDNNVYKLCSTQKAQNVAHSNYEISMLKVIGLPAITKDIVIDGTNIIPKHIELSATTNKFLIYT